MEGWQVWDLVQRLGGQLRIVTGACGGVVIGWDIGAALQLARRWGCRRAWWPKCCRQLRR